MKVILIEDNLTIIKGLEYLFTQNNYTLISATTIKEAENLVKNEIIDIILLDVSLPDGNGFEFYKNTIKQLEIPTIFLTAMDTEDDIVNGLELGADDYITKPFSTRELLARIKRITLKKEKSVIQIGDIKYDFNKMEAYKNNELITLTSLELKILNLLLLNLNKVVTREYLLESIWNWTGNDVNDNTVTVYLKRIREKLGSDIIITVKGIGYRIDEKK